MSKNKSSNRSTHAMRIPIWVWIALAIGIVAVVGFVFVMQTQKPASVSSTPPLEISDAELVAKQQAGDFILDVREQTEWNQFHLAGATLIPLGQLPARLNEVPKDKEIVVVCRTGHRSAQGRDILLSNGFTRVTSMTGGLTQYIADGYPTVSGP